MVANSLWKYFLYQLRENYTFLSNLISTYTLRNDKLNLQTYSETQNFIFEKIYKIFTFHIYTNTTRIRNK